MNIEGRLDIDLYCRHRQVSNVSIRSGRPVDAVRVFVGREVTDVLQILPLLYSICGTAQAMACASACEQALGVQVSAPQRRARDLLVMAETVREHLWRILLDWPSFAGRDAGEGSLAALTALPKRLHAALYPCNNAFQLGGGAVAADRRALHACLEEAQALVETQVLDLTLDAWCAIEDEAALLAWADGSDSIAAVLVRQVAVAGWSDFGRCGITALPPLAPESLHDCLQTVAADLFVRQPQWEGRQHETTPLVRQHDSALIASLQRTSGNGLLSRLVARLHELVVTLAGMRSFAEQLESDPGGYSPERRSGTGLAQIEAARGRLIHRVEVADGSVTRYQIVAPTEWNFHPRGLLAQALQGGRVEAADTLYQQAMLLVNAIDPCVDYRIRMH